MLPNNIAALRKKVGMSQTKLADAVGTSLNMLGKLERGHRNLTTSWLEKIAGALDVEPSQLIASGERAPVRQWSGSDPRPDLMPPAGGGADTVEITSLDLSLSMGPGTLIEEFVEAEPVQFDLRLIQSITRTPSDRLRLVKGIGDSMEPTLRTGDRVLVDINERALARINGVYWIDHLGTHGIKRLRAAGRTSIMVISDNPLVPDFEVPADDLRIEGRVIWFAREV